MAKLEITEDQINEAAKKIAKEISPTDMYSFKVDFRHGARWMQDQMQPEWISVKDRLPEIGVMVLVHRLEGYYSVDQYRQLHGEIRSFMYNVTHWMPLPSPPKQ